MILLLVVPLLQLVTCCSLCVSDSCLVVKLVLRTASPEDCRFTPNEVTTGAHTLSVD
jgi:hypothetical protein